jgi:hypothetical protein
MGQQIAIGLGAGLAAALVYSAANTGTPAALILFYVATLPLFIAGLGWGWVTAGLAAIAGTFAVMFVLGPIGGLIFMLAIGAPAAWLSYLSSLSRQTQTAAGPRQEWYPPGHLIAWCSVIGGCLILPAIATFGFSLKAYEASIRDVFERLISNGAQQSSGMPPGLDAEHLATLFVRYMPPLSVIIWMATTLACMYLAARIVLISGKSRRPWPDLMRFELPSGLTIALAAALVASFLPGLVGLISGAFAAGFAFAYTLLGLAVLHVVTLPSPMRPIFLGAIYFALLFLGWTGTVLSWTGALVAILGLAEPALHLRARTYARMQGRGGPPAPGNDNSNSRSD